MCDCEGVHLCVLALQETDDLFRISPVTERDLKKRLTEAVTPLNWLNRFYLFCVFSVFCCISCLI